MEEAQATPEQLAIRELNAGVYCFRQPGWLWSALQRVPLSPKGEYYLTDVVGMAVGEGQSVQAVELDDPEEVLGVNTRVHLAEAEKAMRARVNAKWMLAGVTLIDPEKTYIEAGRYHRSRYGRLAGHLFAGCTQIGEGCTIGPNTIIVDTQIGSRCTILASVLEGALLEDQVSMGPYGHLRKGAHLAKACTWGILAR